jgi:hypothetical protein
LALGRRFGAHNDACEFAIFWKADVAAEFGEFAASRRVVRPVLDPGIF